MTEQLSAKHISRLIILRHRLIERGPERFAMANWFVESDNDDVIHTVDWVGLARQPEHYRDMLTRPEATACGTAACLAGHAVVTWPRQLADASTADVAEFLGMDVGCTDRPFVDWFAVGNWPERLRTQRAQLAHEWRLRVRAEPNRDDMLDLERQKENALNAFDHQAVIDMLDDLIHGRRLHWYDEDTTTTDRADLVDAQDV